MTSKQLNKEYEKAKAEYLACIIHDNGTYTCKGCNHEFQTIEIHHMIKRSRSLYYYADPLNFMELCPGCHHKAEGTIEQQKQLICYELMKVVKELLLNKYYRLKPYEQTLLWKYENK